jgi:exosortase/archaeosortase family protein
MKPKQKSQKDKKADLTKTINIKRFAITYLVLISLFFLLIAMKPIQNIVDLNGLYTKAIIFITAKILEIMGIFCICQGPIITIAGISLHVKFGCNGLEAVLIYAAGFIVIQIINIIRIVTLAYSCIYFKDLFEYIHIYIAEGIMIAVTLGMYIYWIGYAKEGP